MDIISDKEAKGCHCAVMVARASLAFYYAILVLTKRHEGSGNAIVHYAQKRARKLAK